MSKTGAILGYVKASSSAPFQEERLGQGLYLGGFNVTYKYRWKDHLFNT